MSTRPRPAHCPLAVRVAFLTGNAAGAALLVVSAVAPSSTATATTRPEPSARAVSTTAPAVGTGLQPGTLVQALRAVLPQDAADPRVSGVYGSGHHGSWQFAAYLTWRAPGGQVHGGWADLPAGGDTTPRDLLNGDDRLHLEHDIGWTLPHLDQAARQLADTDAPLALLDLEIPPSGIATVTACSTSAQHAQGSCTQQTDGTTASTFPSPLTDDPGLGALAVHR